MDYIAISIGMIRIVTAPLTCLELNVNPSYPLISSFSSFLYLSITGMVNSTSVIVPRVLTDVRGGRGTVQRTGSALSKRCLRFHKERKC